MATVYTDSQHYSAIAEAIRTKANSSDTYQPSEMAQAIIDIPSGSGNEQFYGDGVSAVNTTLTIEGE